MARRLAHSGITIDLLVSSPANRAKKTALFFARELKRNESEIIFIPELYHAHSDSYYEIIPGFPDSASSIAFFSHNPGITDFANSLTTTRVDNMPTCSVFAVTIQISAWADFRDGEKKFLFFDYPKSTTEK